MRLWVVLVFSTLLSSLVFGQAKLADSIRHPLEKNELVKSVEYKKLYYPSGELEMEGWMYLSMYEDLDPNRKRDEVVENRVGTWHRYYKNGSIKIKEYIPLYDSLQTLEIHYDKKGRKKAEHRLKYAEQNDRLTSDKDFSSLDFTKKYNRRAFYKDGTVKYDINFCDLHYCGPYIDYYKNGKIRYKLHYIENGKKHGEYTYYYEEGQLQEKGQYKNGKKAGKWVFYQPDGTIKKEKSYD